MDEEGLPQLLKEETREMDTYEDKNMDLTPILTTNLNTE